jgi:hypothetical protein
MVKHLVKGKI